MTHPEPILDRDASRSDQGIVSPTPAGQSEEFRTADGSQPPASPPSRSRRTLVWATLAIIGVGTVVTVGMRGASASEPASAPEVPAVRVVVAKEGAISEKQSFAGEFAPFQQVDLHAKVAGFLKSIRVDVGDRVKEGDTLAVIEQPDLADETKRAQAGCSARENEVSQAEAEAAEIHVRFQRLQSVVTSKPQLVAPQDVEELQAKDRAAAAGVEAARSRLAVARAELDRLHTIASLCTITAPFAGVITKRYADPGAVIQGGMGSMSQATPLVRLTQCDHLRLRFSVPEASADKLKVGQEIIVKTPTGGEPLSCRVSRATDDFDPSTRTMQLEADVANADLRMLPGMTGEVSVVVEHRDRALLVPVETVSRRGNRATVLAVSPGGILEEREVELGLEDAELVEVRKGLSAGDQVVRGSRGVLKVGQRVQPSAAAETDR